LKGTILRKQQQQEEKDNEDDRFQLLALLAFAGFNYLLMQLFDKMDRKLDENERKQNPDADNAIKQIEDVLLKSQEATKEVNNSKFENKATTPSRKEDDTDLLKMETPNYDEMEVKELKIETPMEIPEETDFAFDEDKKKDYY